MPNDRDSAISFIMGIDRVRSTGWHKFENPKELADVLVHYAKLKLKEADKSVPEVKPIENCCPTCGSKSFVFDQRVFDQKTEKYGKFRCLECPAEWLPEGDKK
jgi:hypothetical protein